MVYMPPPPIYPPAIVLPMSAVQLNPAIQLRWYQQEAITQTLDYFMRGNTGNPVICLPTGTGKSLVQSGFMVQCLMNWPRLRFLCLTHVKELVAQNAKDTLDYWPTAPIGIYSAGLGQKVAHTPIVFGGVASVVNDIASMGWRDVIFIDECHLVSGKDESMYGAVIAGLRKINPNLKVIGLTATPYRAGHGLITDGHGLFTDITYDMTTMAMFNLLLTQGYLCPINAPSRTSVNVADDNLRMRNGDYRLEDVQAVMDVDAVTDAAVREMCGYGQSRRAWLTFASGVEHAKHVNDRLLYYGVPSTVVHGELSDKERDKRLEDYQAGRYVSCVNFGVLTTGFNYKAVDMIAHLRKTQSTGLWVQMNGRGTRPLYATGYDLTTDNGRFAAVVNGPKPNCLGLDFAGNTKRLGPINDPIIPRKKGNRLVMGMPPVKICPQCSYYNHTRASHCCNCSYEFPVNVNIDATASFDELLRTEKPVVENFDVKYVTYHRRQYKHGEPFMMVTYHCGAMGIQTFEDKIWLENVGPSLGWSRDWWRKRYVGDGTARRPQSFVGYVPISVDEALQLTGYLKTPRTIRVRLDKKESEIIGQDY
jgi:DNA repair protein RadD